LKQATPDKRVKSKTKVEAAAFDGDTAPPNGAELLERESRWNYALVGSGLGVWDHNLRLGKRY